MKQLYTALLFSIILAACQSKEKPARPTTIPVVTVTESPKATPKAEPPAEKKPALPIVIPDSMVNGLLKIKKKFIYPRQAKEFLAVVGDTSVTKKEIAFQSLTANLDNDDQEERLIFMKTDKESGKVGVLDRKEGKWLLTAWIHRYMP